MPSPSSSPRPAQPPVDPSPGRAQELLGLLRARGPLSLDELAALAGIPRTEARAILARLSVRHPIWEEDGLWGLL